MPLIYWMCSFKCADCQRKHASEIIISSIRSKQVSVSVRQKEGRRKADLYLWKKSFTDQEGAECAHLHWLVKPPNLEVPLRHGTLWCKYQDNSLLILLFFQSWNVRAQRKFPRSLIRSLHFTYETTWVPTKSMTYWETPQTGPLISSPPKHSFLVPLLCCLEQYFFPAGCIHKGSLWLYHFSVGFNFVFSSPPAPKWDDSWAVEQSRRSLLLLFIRRNSLKLRQEKYSNRMTKSK